MRLPDTTGLTKLAASAAVIALVTACSAGQPALETFDRDDITSSGTVTEIEGGINVDGPISIQLEEDESFDIEEADLDLLFDEVGKLIDVSGDATLSGELTDTLTVNSAVKTEVGLRTGAQINEDPDFGIELVADRQYLVFYLGGDANLQIENRATPGTFEEVTLSSPLDSRAFIVVDPRDPMHYRFGSTALVGAYGWGESTSGLLPFSPRLGFSELDSFYGHKLDNGAMGIGFKVFDFFEIEGTRVIKDPQFSEINWDDPFASEIEARAGINGGLNFAFGVLGVGVFAFDLVDTSGTIDLGFDRQQAAFALRIDPDTSWVPEWFHFVPETEATGQLFVNGNTDFSLELTSRYKSRIPEADLAGTMAVDNQSTTLTGTTINAGQTLEASITFENLTTTGRVGFPEEFMQAIQTQVRAEIDDMLNGAEDKVAALQQAKTDYEFEASLRGLRPQLPVIADSVTAYLNALPGAVEAQAEQTTRNYINNTCINSGLVKPCIRSVLSEQARDNIVESAGTNAREEVDEAIVTPLEVMAELKKQALEGDDDALRTALKAALQAAYDQRNLKKDVSIEHNFGFPFGRRTIYTTTVERQILNEAQQKTILDARNFVDYIPAASNTYIRAQDILDAIPADEVLQSVKAQVDESMDAIPEVGGVGYIAEDSTYRAFLTIGGTDYDVGFNVLDPVALKQGVAELIVLQLSAALE
ncbi:MAG: hypothetical protein AAF996_10915 [Pseudomonadota bacterium]